MPKPPESSDAAGKRDYRDTLFLPATEFPMKAGLAAAEPQWLARWERMDLYGRLRAAAKAEKRPLFILHDGPPYANGDIHIGTALNKILKDFVVRSQSMLGKDAPYVPGWDCHGLPIEWKIEEEYRAQGKSKDEVPLITLRAQCRAFATKWIGIQREQFKRMGAMGDWSRPYTTMAFPAEAAIVRELHKFALNGLLYRGSRPVMWSPVEKTALAEAEVEYHEKQSPTIYVKFPVKDSPDVSVVIWTTTPWTIPGNRAIAYSPELAYGIYEVVDATEGSLGSKGERIAVADVLAEQTAKHCKIEVKRVGDFAPKGVICHHPLHGYGYDFPVPLLPGEHVTADTGTGFVHTAPGHGEEDFALGRAHGLEVPFTVGQEGEFLPNVPIFAGKKILKPDGKDGDANGAVIKELIERHALLGKGTLRHQYPHSWRSGAPVIFRATPQWFIAVDKEFTAADNHKGTLRQIALDAIEATQWFPAQGANRIGAMVRERPDWVLSRQRAWGVPIAVFVNKKTSEVLRDADVNARIYEAFEKEGADAWYTSPASRFLGAKHNASDYDQINDILDVWFESGTTHAFVVENPVEKEWPKAAHADLYLEGSDQHRGWFQSSLLETCGTQGRAPYDAVLTHGFVLDEQGRKMSKKLGNTVAPQTVAEANGAEILRLWSASSDFTEDLRIGPEIIKTNVDAYRRLRNTIRFLLANLAEFDERERIVHREMPELERYLLARLAGLDREVREGYARYDFNRVFTTVFNFATTDLSAFYFDVRKDALYCDGKTSTRRRAARTVLDELFRRLVTWLAPVLCFTMEEAWTTRFGNGDDVSVHLQLFPETPAAWTNDALIVKWDRIRELRRVVTGALEIARRDKVIGASLEAAPTLYLESGHDLRVLDGVDLAEITITSDAYIEKGSGPADAFRLPEVQGVAATFAKASGEKCARCWRILPEVGHKHADLCNRCAEVVG